MQEINKSLPLSAKHSSKFFFAIAITVSFGLRSLCLKLFDMMSLLVIMVLGMTLNCLHRVIYLSILSHPGTDDLSCGSAVKQQLSLSLSLCYLS